MYKSPKFFLLFMSFFFLVASTWAPLNDEDEDYYYKLKKSWQHMQNVFEKINTHYVEEIDPYPLVRAGIEGMLEHLDPYTVFIEEDGERRLRMITTGKYGGLGMEIGIKNKKVTVISPMDNSPAIRAGVRAGDIIEEIDGKKVDELSIDKVSALLRGEIGTQINFMLKRSGLDKPIELTLTRSEIIIEDVGYAGFVSPGVAYVSLNGFTDKAYTELRSAIGNLRREGNIDKFILDLRGNPGGLLDAAVDVVNVFVPAGETVVYTKGYREGEIFFKTRKHPVLLDVPLVVLVDEGSASASEIVAGALQDMDRAVIAGQETFGKGLVQKVFTVDNASDAKIKITTAKYYIPSGRSIQKKDYGVGNEIIVDKKLNDEEIARYFTKNKREVFDHGGVHPDIMIKGDSLDYVLIELIRTNHFFNFGVKYYQKNPEWKESIFDNGKLFNEFKLYLRENNFEFEVEGSFEIEKLRQIAESRSSSKELMELITKLEENLELEKEKYLEQSQEMVKRYLKLELAEKYQGRKGRYKYSIENDLQVRGAISVLANQTDYNKILAVK